MAGEFDRSFSYGGRSVFGWEPPEGSGNGAAKGASRFSKGCAEVREGEERLGAAPSSAHGKV